ncbi:hypothetical protein HYFRA_00012739 [Hymenoscyphus fraxineus]|uniref:Uncharacterized protein n=1 Tax=Hymenoscyphus fraxineus TaxID=746836 RepID=A0A9N9L519_9HELO|nr:hypothetical protein HYFRA_00012739 [Hymenoscyphus fraxineus]
MYLNRVYEYNGKYCPRGFGYNSIFRVELSWHYYSTQLISNADRGSVERTARQLSDSSTGKIIGGALWKICPTNPFEKTEHEDAYWFPEGGEREFVNEALERFEPPRATMRQRLQSHLQTPRSRQPNYGLGHRKGARGGRRNVAGRNHLRDPAL